MKKNLYMDILGKKAKLASLNLTSIDIKKRNSVLKSYCSYLKNNSKAILNCNKKDMANAKLKKITGSMLSRLELNNKI